MLKRITLTFFVLICFVSSTANALEVPTLRGRVNDLAGVLQEQTLQELEQNLAQFEQESSNQIAVLIIPSLEGDNLEEYSHRVAETWGLGQKDKDNGVLLLIAKNDRKLRIEVGYGLESFLTDALSSYIINREITPQFKNGNFDEGVTRGVTAMIGAIKNTYKPDLSKSSSSDFMPWGARIFFFVVWAIVVGVHSLTALFNRSTAGAIIHYIFLIPFWISFPMVIFGVFFGVVVAASFIFGFPLLRIFFAFTGQGQEVFNKLHTKKSSNNAYWYSGLGRSIGKSGGSSSRSSFSSFSGGGGSFGGGGSSGSW